MQGETSFKGGFDTTTQDYAALLLGNEKLQKQLQDEKKRSDQLEEKVSHLESEIQVLRQQAHSVSPTATTSLAPKTTVILALAPVPHLRELNSEERPQKSLHEKQQEIHDLLVKSISQDLGFSKGKPVAAFLIYKCLLQWRLFEVERTRIFDRIIQTISVAIKSQDNNDVLSYWLSNSATLLLLVQRTLKASGAATRKSRRWGAEPLIARVPQGLQGSPQSAGFSLFSGRPLGELNESRQVEAKYPVLLFNQELTASLKSIYGMIRDNLKKEISPVLDQCIQALRTSGAGRGKGRSQDNVVDQQALIAHWQNIVKTLNSYLNTMRANHVPSLLIQKVFTQTFEFINVQMFNSLLAQRECCSFSNGECLKSVLSELEQWCIDSTEEYAGSSWEELKHVCQTVGFLVLHQKPEKSLKEITTDVCFSLSIQQLYRISTIYRDDKYGTHNLSAEVIHFMRVILTDDSMGCCSYLLEQYSGIPFTVDDIAKSVELAEMVDVEPPPLLRQNSGFAFLQQ